MPDNFDQKFAEVEKQLTANLTGKYNYIGGDIGEGEIETFLKTMSESGMNDGIIADRFETWLKENKIAYIRFDHRKFHINTKQLFSALNVEEK